MSQLANLSELRAKAEQDRTDFLQTDLALCFTFAAIAKTEIGATGDPRGAERALQKAEDGYATITRFLGRVGDVEKRDEIERKLAELRTVLDSVRAVVHGGSETDRRGEAL
jgi:hypothetical protein